ncbi:helix-turn-helix domain-containing protein [Xylophilus rhododendri]|uniref:Helix-turn-helix domain-containing protein n=1 Tax=Xylophilus rhododendri TaxID=2697032 RepID=A0A857J661_9BURK|nr:IclR family transcriptional regulator [Xylophilus rhododendri]QHI98579.1 helix-turn-helix domain-containing protein [Xylophilus rhododendri]
MKDDGAAAPTAGAQVVRRALAVLRIVAAAQERGVRVVDVVDATGLNRPTVHRLLQVLVEEGAAERDAATRRYLIGRDVSLMGLARSARFPIRSVAAPFLRELSEREGDTSFLTIRNGDESVCLARHPGGYPIKVLSIEVGARRPLGVGVSGLVLLADLPPEEVAAVMARNSRPLQALRLDIAAVAGRLEETRRLGYAYAPVGVVPGTRALAVPVRHPGGQVLAGLAVTAIADRLPAERLQPLVQAMQQQALGIAQQWAQRLRPRGPADNPASAYSR